eukprot:424054-Rhodomonas_salina.1
MAAVSQCLTSWTSQRASDGARRAGRGRLEWGCVRGAGGENPGNCCARFLSEFFVKKQCGRIFFCFCRPSIAENCSSTQKAN